MVEGNEGRSWKKLNVFICLWFVQVLIYCKEHMSSVAHFLESRGMLKDALEVATDHLAIQLGSRCWKGAILSLSASSASSFCSLELLNFDRLVCIFLPKFPSYPVLDFSVNSMAWLCFT